MQSYPSHTNTNNQFLVRNEFLSDSGSEDDQTIDHELPVNNKKPLISSGHRPTKPDKALAEYNPRNKSILKASRTFDKSSFEDMIPGKNNFFHPERGHPQIEASEISEIEKIGSVINKSEEQLKDENSHAERTTATKPTTKIPNFNMLSKFSPQKEPMSLDMSSPTSQGYDPGERKDTEEMKVAGIVGAGSRMTKPSIPMSDSHDVRGIQHSDRANFSETPGFRKEIKKKNTNETVSNSLTALQQEEHTSHQAWVKEEAKSRTSNSDMNEVGKKAQADIQRKNIKKTTFVEKNAAHITPGYLKYLLDENINQRQVYMPNLSDREITEAFNTLDMNKDGYITGDEIAYFLEVLEENPTEAEIEEMIRMLDYEGTGKVRYEEFYKLAIGKDLNPIGQAYPPTLDQFEKKKVVEAKRNRIETVETTSPRNAIAKSSSNKEATGLIEMTNYSKENGKIDSKLSKLPRLGDLGDDETKHVKTDKDERDSYFKGFIRQAGLNSKTFVEKYDIVQFSNDQRVSKASYKDFLGFFCIDHQDVTKKVFSLISRDRTHIDMRQVMIALSLYLDFSVDEKIARAYELYDPENHEYILYNELMKIFKMFQLGEEHKKIEKKIKIILNKRSIMPEDSISREDFVLICKNFPDLFNSM